jgi:translation initiation factor IF-3
MVDHITDTAKKLRVNKMIRAKEMRLIGEDGEQIGVVTLKEALDKALEVDLDLVEINPTSKPPVCKLMDYGKHRYESSKKERESRQKRKIIEVKEVKFRPKIDIHDYETKKKMAIRFIKDGDKVKVTLMFRGREVVYRTKGIELLNKLAEELVDLVQVERRPKIEGKNITMILAPKASS